MQKIKELLTRNDKMARLLRTIFQGIIGVIIANIDMIVGGFTLDPQQKTLIVALTMAILSPVMAALGGDVDE